MNQPTMMLHCGGQEVAREQVYHVATPEPEGKHFPIAHHLLLEEVERALSGVGYRVETQQHALAKDGARYFAIMALQAENSDYQTVFGLRNSHDKAYSASLVVGSRVFVCDNLAFSGDIRIARKHTTHILRDLPILTQHAMGMLTHHIRNEEERFNVYKQTELAKSQAHDLMIEMIRSRALPPTRVNDVITEWHTPRHEEFATDGNTAWRLFNAVTESLKGSGTMLIRRTNALHAIMDSACDFTASNDAVIEGEIDIADTTIDNRLAA